MEGTAEKRRSSAVEGRTGATVGRAKGMVREIKDRSMKAARTLLIIGAIPLTLYSGSAYAQQNRNRPPEPQRQEQQHQVQGQRPGDHQRGGQPRMDFFFQMQAPQPYYAAPAPPQVMGCAYVDQYGRQFTRTEPLQTDQYGNLPSNCYPIGNTVQQFSATATFGPVTSVAVSLGNVVLGLGIK